MKANTADKITSGLAVRMEAAWQRYELERRQGVTHALPFLRRWHKIRTALECWIRGDEFVVSLPGEDAASEESADPAGSSAGGTRFFVYQEMDGSAFLTVPVPPAVCRYLEGLTWQASFDAIDGHHCGIFAKEIATAIIPAT